jgi:Ca2+-binding EF-hand superfamily protein
MEGLPFLGSPSNGIKGHKVGTKPQRSTNGKTVAERIAWMSRTSDVLGSFHNMTAESNTNLIRRKIQERCGNTQELMAAIRRLKTGDTGHVTPTEFRLTMIKFGISIPQSLCDTIFSLFDSDRSGTIDFDEFAMWIMNSEFRPVKKSEKLNDSETPEELLRKRLKLCLEQFPEVFATMKKRISFLDLSADIVRKEMPMTEKDARHLFKILDPNNSGLIDSIMLKRYAFDGITDPIPSSSSGPFNPKKSTSRPKPDLQESIFKICGHNTNLLLNCFRNYDQQNSQLQYDEFRSALLTQNLGVNPKDTQNLFLALDGAKGVCELSILFKTVKPTPLDPASVVSSKVTVSLTLCSSPLPSPLPLCFSLLTLSLSLSPFRKRNLPTSLNQEQIVVFVKLFVKCINNFHKLLQLVTKLTLASFLHSSSVVSSMASLSQSIMKTLGS